MHNEVSRLIFCKEVVVSVDLILDGCSAQIKSLVKKFCDQVGTVIKTLKRTTPWATRAELFIGLLKESARKDMIESKSPMVLWDYAIEHRALTHNAVNRPILQSHGKNLMNALLEPKIKYLASEMLAGVSG